MTNRQKGILISLEIFCVILIAILLEVIIRPGGLREVTSEEYITKIMASRTNSSDLATLISQGVNANAIDNYFENGFKIDTNNNTTLIQNKSIVIVQMNCDHGSDEVTKVTWDQSVKGVFVEGENSSNCVELKLTLDIPSTGQTRREIKLGKISVKGTYQQQQGCGGAGVCKASYQTKNYQYSREDLSLQLVSPEDMAKIDKLAKPIHDIIINRFLFFLSILAIILLGLVFIGSLFTSLGKIRIS